MMKPFLAIMFAFLLSYSNSFAQTNNTIDSLKKAMDSYTHNDTVKVMKMAHYAWSLSQKDPEQAIQVLDKAIELAKNLQWSSWVAKLYRSKGETERRQEKYDAAIVNYLFALKIAEDIHYSEAYYDIHFDLSETYRQMGDYELAKLHAQRCLDIATTEKNDGAFLWGFSTLAAIYNQNKQLDSASIFLEKAMNLAIKLNDEYTQNWLLGLRAGILRDRDKDYAGALNLYHQILAYALKTDNKPGIAWMRSVISGIFADLNNQDSAYYHAERALEIAKKYNLPQALKDSYEALYLAHAKFDDYKKAYEYKLVFDSLYNKNFNPQSGKNAEKARLELEQQRKDALAEAEKIKKEAAANRFKYLLAGIAVIGLIAAGFQYRNSRQKQKAKSKIEKAYSELKSTQAQLIQSEKMASLGELTAGIAHEIQNPLNFVNNFSEVSNELLDEMKEELSKGNYAEVAAITNDVKENLEKINHHGKRADGIVKGMLQHSRNSAGQKELTDINALCDEYLRLAYHGLRAKDKSFNAKFETDFDTSLPEINIAAQDIGRVVLNLINNAFYAVTEKSKLAIPGYEPLVLVSTKTVLDKQGIPRAEVRVKDNGTGIPRQVVDKIFQPFFTTKPTGQGTGLGLSLSYDIITKGHNGRLSVETEEGLGTEFIFVV